MQNIQILYGFQSCWLLLAPPPPSPITTTISTIFKCELKIFFWRGELDGKGVINNWRKGSGFLEIGLINLLHGSYLTYSVFHKNATFSFLQDVSNLLKLWMVLTLIYISSPFLVLISKFDLSLAICIKVFQ